MNRMNGINRFLSRRDKSTHGDDRHKKVMSSPAVETPSRNSSSTSSSYHSPRTSSRHSFYLRSSSLSSLSIAFTPQVQKQFPVMQLTEGTILSSTANTYEHLLLQPKQTAGSLHGLFPEEELNVPVKDDEKKIKTLILRLKERKIPGLKESDLRYVLNGPYAKGDPNKAFELFEILQESEDGIIVDPDPSVTLLGAVNRDAVSCYLDSVLFAMFARLGSFEAILCKNFEDEPRKKLAMWIRLWVNLLRRGKLITTDITRQLQKCLADCGWEEAATSSQQDASEAFSFVTETLALPLLTLKMDIFHTGREEESDDHKFVNERLLEVAVPEDPEDGHTVTLEECLETYFNNRIEVKRYLERRSTSKSAKSWKSAEANSDKASASHAEPDESRMSPISAQPRSLNPFSSPRRKSVTRPRAPSIIQEHFISEKHESLGLSSSVEEKSNLSPLQRTGSVRQVMMPAFQFFSLLPWYTDNKPSNDAQVAAHFESTRPILGICLKRYSVLASGKAIRRHTHIDIPTEIGLPHFIQDDSISEDGPLFGNFKLSLQAAVCHRGKSVHSGHYVSLVRSHESDSFDSPGDRWLRLDDLDRDRVTFVDAQKFLQKESPYLLFYQVQPIEDELESGFGIRDSRNSVDAGGPPSYAVSESRDSGIADLSLSSHNSVETPADSLGSNHTGPEVKSPGEHGECSNIIDKIPQGITFITPEAGNTPQQNIPPPKPNDHNLFAVCYEEAKLSISDPRGRTTSTQHQDRTRLSRSLSRLAGKLAKEKPTETNSMLSEPDAIRVSINSPAQQALKIHTEIAAVSANGPTRLKKEHNNKQNSNRSSTEPSKRLVKGENPFEKKPERECSIM